MVKGLAEEFRDKKILLAGFGKEGQSSLELLLALNNFKQIAIADSNEKVRSKIPDSTQREVVFYTGPEYLKNAEFYDLIIKSPGIQQDTFPSKIPTEKITSQTDLFIKHLKNQIIGITGTKGKSTTSNLIYHLLKTAGKDVFLIGNIGIPPFDVLKNISDETLIVFELSSHQLAHVTHSPAIAILLNLFQEHLDFYKSFDEYALAKLNITKFQSASNWFIYNADDPAIQKLIQSNPLTSKAIPFAKSGLLSTFAWIGQNDKLTVDLNGQTGYFDLRNRTTLSGDHNLLNILAAICACKISGVDDRDIMKGILTFKGLAHRLEFIGTFKSIHFYNDSIATIPEATIEAIKTLKKVDTLILGGKDRGIDYSKLSFFLSTSTIQNLIFMGKAGERIQSELKRYESFEGAMFFIRDFNELTEIIRRFTAKESICLLSPAASSYDMFSNFEERGEAFKKIAEAI